MVEEPSYKPASGAQITKEQREMVEPEENWRLRYHQRPITDLKFNADGDLLFTSCKGETPVVWRVSAGEKIGAYKGHTGAVFSLDIDKDSRRLITGSADQKGILWDVETGKIVIAYDNLVTTKSVAFSRDGRSVVMGTDAIMNHPPRIWIYDTRTGDLVKKHTTETVPTSVNFTLEEDVIYADTTGSVNIVEGRTFSLSHTKKIHQSKIVSLTPSFCHTYFVTGSNDFKSKVFSEGPNREISVIREFLSDSPINTARVSPDNSMVACGGGTDARDVTTTGGKGNFNIEMFDCATSRLVGYYSMHFGTVNAVDIHPSGRTLASGAEDGIVNLINLDDSSFLNAPFTSMDIASE